MTDMLPVMATAEDSLIAKYFAPLATSAGAFGLTDDAAVFRADSGDFVVTADAIVEGVHFLPDDPPDTIARKALRVNLSDLAAKGAEPTGFVVTLALREVRDTWLAPFARALGEDAAHFKCPLLGGDTVATPGPISISITAFGRVPEGKMIRRAGAKPGDAVIVTGTIGDAVLGLDILKGGEIASAMANDASGMAALIDRYRVPQPRTAIAALVRAYATAAMDVSDGLVGDLAKLCAVSNVSGDIRLADVPLSVPARHLIEAKTVSIERLISGGDDYEVLCTVSQASARAFMAGAQAAGIAATIIGEVTAGAEPPRFLGTDGRPIALSRSAYSHF